MTPHRVAALVLLLAGLGLAGPAHADWPSYRGQNGQFAETSGVKLIDDMTRAKLLWESEEREIGFGKTDSGYGRNMSHFGDLMPAGIASPIVAGGLVIQFYAQPTGEVIDETSKAALSPENWEKFKHKARVDADDVVIAIDAAPARLAALGSGWHVNGNPPVHLATGGYELPLLEAFADGIAFFRVAGGIRAYDLRQP